MRRAVLIGALAALALAPSALAAPPTLVTVTQTGGKTSVAWTLPSGGQVWTVEIAKTSTVDSDGYFAADSVVATDVFIDFRTSWSSTQTLAPGTYYVHVSGWDKSCSSCPIPEWSAIRAVTVGSGTASSSSAASSTTGSAASTTGSTTTTAPAASATSSLGSTAPVAGTTASSSTPSASGAAGAGIVVTPAVSGDAGVSGVVVRLKGGIAIVAFKVCGIGEVQVNVAVLRGKGSHLATVTLGLDGCLPYSLGLSAPPGVGRLSVSVGTGVTAASRQP